MVNKKVYPAKRTNNIKWYECKYCKQLFLRKGLQTLHQKSHKNKIK